jgi:hypothetical protein
MFHSVATDKQQPTTTNRIYAIFLYTKLKNVAAVIDSFKSSDVSPWPKPYKLLNNKTKLQTLALTVWFWLTMRDSKKFAADSVNVNTECMICISHYTHYYTTSTALDYNGMHKTA